MQEQTQDGGENYQYPLYILKQQRTMPQGETQFQRIVEHHGGHSTVMHILKADIAFRFFGNI